MELYIAENFRITSDPMNVMLQERKISRPTDKNPEPTERWDTTGYYGTVIQACMAFKRIAEKESLATDISGFVSDLERIEDGIVTAVGKWRNPEHE